MFGRRGPTRQVAMTLRPRASRLALAFSVMVAVGAPVHADVVPVADAAVKERARAHFKAGSALLAVGDYDKAIASYLEAYELLPLPDFLFNLGQAYRLKNTSASRQQAVE